MKKALVVTSTAGFAKGFLLHDMQLLQQMGYEVHCAANASAMVTFKAEEFFSALGIQFHQIDFPSSSPLSKDTLLAAKQLRKLISNHEFSFIHCHTPIVGVVIRIVAAGLRWSGKCKIVYTTHGLAFPKGCSWKDKLLYGTIEWVCAHLCDGIITINWEDYECIRKFGCKQVYHINGVGVDTKKFRNVAIDRADYRQSIGISDSDIMLLAVGELSVRKNHQIVVRALSHIGDDRYVLVICGKAMVGTGTYDRLKALSESLGVRVVFLGFRQDIPEITNCADIVVLPSVREGLGLAGVEALASGVPVIGSDVQGIRDYVIPCETGYLCDPMDVEDFAQRILELSDPEKREAMRTACFEKAEEFSVAVSHRQMQEIYWDQL